MRLCRGLLLCRSLWLYRCLSWIGRGSHPADPSAEQLLQQCESAIAMTPISDRDSADCTALPRGLD